MKLSAICFVALVVLVHIVPYAGAQYNFAGNVPRLGKRVNQRAFAGVPKLGKRLSDDQDEEMMEQYLRNFLLRNPDLARYYFDQYVAESSSSKQSQ